MTLLQAMTDKPLSVSDEFQEFTRLFTAYDSTMPKRAMELGKKIRALEAENKRLRNALLDIYEESQPPAYWHEVAKAALAPPDGLGGYIDNTPEEACICERFPAQRGWVASIRHNVLCPVHKRLPADTEEG